MPVPVTADELFRALEAIARAPGRDCIELWCRPGRALQASPS